MLYRPRQGAFPKEQRLQPLQGSGTMNSAPASAIGWLFDSPRTGPSRLLPRWIFLRALGVIYFSAFFSLIFQIRGLIGPERNSSCRRLS